MVYAERDPDYSYIIRHYNWTVGVECDVQRNETSHGKDLLVLFFVGCGGDDGAGGDDDDDDDDDVVDDDDDVDEDDDDDNQFQYGLLRGVVYF